MTDFWNDTRGRVGLLSSRNDIAPRSSVARKKVDLGHSWSPRGKAGVKTHVVRREGDRWALACTGRRATRQYPGYAEQATCAPCRKAGAA